MKIATLTLNPALDRTMYFDTPFVGGALNRATDTVLTLGGKGINVSRVMKRFGINAPAYGFSGGENGALMEKLLSEEGIDCRFIKTRADTRMNVKMIDSLSVCTEANESGGPVSDSELEKLFYEVGGAAKIHDFFTIGGSIPRGVEKNVYNLLIKRISDAGAKVILDCDGEALSLGTEAKPYMIKPNLYELSGLVGKELKSDREAVENCKRLYGETGVSVLCTMGGRGAVYAGIHGCGKVNSPRVTLKGFTGAGDTFLSAFLYKSERGYRLEEAMRFASSAAAAKVELCGTALPDAEDMDKYAGRLEYTQL